MMVTALLVSLTLWAQTEPDGRLLRRHEPFHFAFGRPLTKVQMSFKSPMVRDVPLYFAYTQVMFWELLEKSKPFRDFTYNPELHYRFRFKDQGLVKDLDLVLWGHHSNGKAGPESRSYDVYGLRLWLEKKRSSWSTRTAITVQNLHHFDPTNRDIRQFVGPLKLSFRWAREQTEIALDIAPGGRWGENWGRGGYQASASFRLAKLWLEPSLYAQYYHGFAETLLNYNQRVNSLRLGVIF